jgi:hypothetical protein
VDVAKLLDPFALAEDIEVIIARLPEGFAISAAKSSRDPLLHRLQCGCERSTLGVAQQKMHMLRHDYITAYEESILAPSPLQRLLTNGAGEGCIQPWESSVTTERDKVEMTGLLESFQSAGHVEIVLSSERNKAKSKSPP